MEINKIYNMDVLSFLLKEVPDNFIDLVITSPPYYNAKSYSTWDNYGDYLDFFADVFYNLRPKLKDNGRIAVNVPDGYGRNPRIPLYPDVCQILQENYVLRGSIVWRKPTGGHKTSWGSWRSASNPSIIDEHEMIILAHKLDPKIESDEKIDKDMFLSLIHSVWDMQPETSKKYHPAPFPVELPIRLITLLSSKKSLVFDPFMGGGTTAIACLRTSRNYLGCEINKEFYELSLERIKEVQ